MIQAKPWLWVRIPEHPKPKWKEKTKNNKSKCRHDYLNEIIGCT